MLPKIPEIGEIPEILRGTLEDLGIMSRVNPKILSRLRMFYNKPGSKHNFLEPPTESELLF